MDEVSLDLEPPLHACWMKRDQQRVVPALQPGSKQHSHFFGAYCWNDDQVRWKAADWKNSQHFISFWDGRIPRRLRRKGGSGLAPRLIPFIEFIEYLLVGQYSKGRIVLVMDNVSYHKSAAVQATLSLFEHRLLVIWLPPYCPEFNLIERFWKHLKDLACANKLHNLLEDVVASVEYVLCQQNDPTSSLRLTFSKDL